ncbi:MAG: site-specific integrase [Selenomonadaceae bacterium]|nr:site-specific integrase [Selenomonadaceae bacterium]
MAQVRIRKRGKTFSYIFEAGKKSDGKRKVVEKGGFATRNLAYDAGVAAYIDWKHGNIGIVSENIALKDFMTNWLKNVVALNVKPNTMQMYSAYFKKYILPKLGDIPVQELTPAKLDAWIRELSQEGYAKNTLSQMRTLIRNALNYAIYPAKLISANPANYIKVPKKAPTNVVKRHIITKEKLSELLEKYPFGSPYYIPILILYHTGMRISEVCGLTWDNFDLENNVVTLNKQIVYLNKKGYFFSTLKTQSSNRYIFISNFLAGELKRWKNQQIENEKIAGDSYVYVYRNSEDKIIQQSKSSEKVDAEKVLPVCTRLDGRAIFKYLLTNIFKDEGINAHSFRHTHATMLIENGAIPKGVAKRLGHSNTAITQNLYTHNTRKLQEDAAEIFEKAVQANP